MPKPTNVIQLNYYLFPEIKLLDTQERWRRVGKILGITKAGFQRLEWIIYYYKNQHNVTLTCRHFGIARKTFYKWLREFDEDNLYSLYKLEDRSKAPKRVRQRQITQLQEQRIITLRRRHMRWGKMKLAQRYHKIYGEKISSWKVQKVIESWKLYRNPKKVAKTAKKRLKSRSQPKRKLIELKDLAWYQKTAGYIICLDAITIYWQGLKRYIFTAIDKFGKVAFARMYMNKSSQSAKDFLERLYYLLDGQVPRVGHDNGGEFKQLFQKACDDLKIEQYWSRPRTPKDNPENERFNQTLEDEFLAEGTFHPDPKIFNQRLTEWLIEYNFIRPHEALNYETPLDASHLLPMYSSCTRH